MRVSCFTGLALAVITFGFAAEVRAESDAPRSLAAAFVEQAVKRCGHEASVAGEALREPRAPGSAQSSFVEQLWERTWKCDPGFIGRSCMAARWALCERVFAEYGPEGVVLPGLLKPIIHK